MTADALADLLDHVADHSKVGDPASVLSAIDDYSYGRPELMHLGREKSELVERVVSARAPRRILELGAFFGYSAIRLALCLPEGGRLVSVEANPTLADLTRIVLEVARLSDRVDIVPAPSEDAIEALREPFDVVLLDHDEARYLTDLRHLEDRGLVTAGTVVIADNVLIGAEHASDYLVHVRRSGRYDSLLHRFGTLHGARLEDGVEISTARW